MSDQTLFFYESEQILISSKIKQQYIAQHSRATAARSTSGARVGHQGGHGDMPERTTQIYPTLLENSVIENANREILKRRRCMFSLLHKCTMSKLKLNVKLCRLNYFQYLCCHSFFKEKEMKEINRLKSILAEKNKTGKWLAEQLGKDPSTVSKWCSNSSQPPLEMVIRIAELLAVDIKDLIK